jgi:hypothetical protein
MIEQSKWFKIPGSDAENDVFVKVVCQDDEIALHQQAKDRGWELVELSGAPDWYNPETELKAEKRLD